MNDTIQGWFMPINLRKAHYFKAGLNNSICGKIFVFHKHDGFEDDNHNSPDNCVACKRAYEKERKL